MSVSSPSRSSTGWRAGRWRRWIGPIVVALIIVVTGIAYGIAQSSTVGLRLDPQSAQPDGGRALATLLSERGVEVTKVERLDDAVAAVNPDTTLLVAVPDSLIGGRLERLASAPAGHVVLLEPGEDVLEQFAPDVYPAGSAFATVREPGCTLHAARRAGTVETAGRMYRARNADQTCYGDGSRDAVVRYDNVDVVGTATSFQNQRLAEQGNAALAMNLLGDRDRLVWYVPSIDDLAATEEDQQSLFGLLPAGVQAGVGMAVVAVVLIGVAAARRLGPVVTEPLPVRVQAAETMEGRARLYRRSHATEQAATALRTATRVRLAARLGLPGEAPVAELTAAVSSRTGRPASEVTEILAGAVPPDDDALTKLTGLLDRLEQEVIRS